MDGDDSMALDLGDVLAAECEREGVSLAALRTMRTGPSALVPVRVRIVNRLLDARCASMVEIADILHCHRQTVRMILKAGGRKGARRMTEKQLQAAIVRLAKLRGWMTYHTYDSRRSEPGFPDLVLVRGEAALYRELKAGQGRLTEAQRKWLDALSAAGQDAGVWRDSDWRSGAIDEALR